MGSGGKNLYKEFMARDKLGGHANIGLNPSIVIFGTDEPISTKLDF